MRYSIFGCIIQDRVAFDPEFNHKIKRQNQMKITLGTNDIVDYLLDEAPKAWTRSGALALAEWLQEMEIEFGFEMEFDSIEIRTSYDEYKSVAEAAGEYGWEPGEFEFYPEQEAAARHFLEKNTDIRVFASGVIVRKF